MIKEIDVFDNIPAYKENFYMMNYRTYLLNIEKIITLQGEKKNEKDKQNLEPCDGNGSCNYFGGMHFR